jgi:hypothetical protein
MPFFLVSPASMAPFLFLFSSFALDSWQLPSTEPLVLFSGDHLDGYFARPCWPLNNCKALNLVGPLYRGQLVLQAALPERVYCMTSMYLFSSSLTSVRALVSLYIADVVSTFDADALLENSSGFFLATPALIHDDQDGVLDIGVVLFLLVGEQVVQQRGLDQCRCDKPLASSSSSLGTVIAHPNVTRPCQSMYPTSRAL